MTIAEIGTWLYSQLSTDTAVTAITTRIYPFTTSEPRALPWVVWDNLTVEYGFTKDSSEPLEASLSILCATSTYSGGVALADAVIAAVNDLSGVRVKSVHSEYNPEVGFLNEISILIQM